MSKNMPSYVIGIYIGENLDLQKGKTYLWEFSAIEEHAVCLEAKNGKVLISPVSHFSLPIWEKLETGQILWLIMKGRKFLGRVDWISPTQAPPSEEEMAVIERWFNDEN